MRLRFMFVSLCCSGVSAILGSCEECEECVAACGARCLERAFGDEPTIEYNLLDAVPRCCMRQTEPDAYGNRDRDCWTNPPDECKAIEPQWARVAKYWRCRRTCDEQWPERLENMKTVAVTRRRPTRVESRCIGSGITAMRICSTSATCTLWCMPSAPAQGFSLTSTQ